MGRHALLSASSSHRWLACPPSARLCENYEDTGSEYAQQGTDAHSLCEHKLKLSLGMETEDPTEGLEFYDEEMEECACGYAEYVLSLVEEARQSCKDPVVLIEQRLDFVNPVIIDRDFNVIAGHGRIAAAKEEGITEVPCVFVDYLTEAQKKAYILADNRMALDAGWDEELLRIEIESLQGADFDVSLTGFGEDELADLFSDSTGKDVKDDDFDLSAALEKAAFVERGDIWTVGRHRLMCGDATSAEDVAALMDGKKANLIVTDPPYGVSFKSSGGLTIQNDSMKGDEFYTFLYNSFACIDPRFKYVTRGCAEYVEWLGQKENPAGKGWATGVGYGEKILTILGGILGTAGGAAPFAPTETEFWYRVRKTWSDASSQKGAFKVLENAKKCADENPEYSVFDESGKAVYTKAAAFKPYLVRVTIPDLNIRKGPGTDYGKTGKYTGIGTFTIVEEADGKGASKWGLLKSYQGKRNGWVSLDYCKNE